MKKIIVKEIDQLKSKTFKNKIIFEYLIYISFEDTIINAYTVIGNEAKEIMVDNLLHKHFTSEEILNRNNIIQIN